MNWCTASILVWTLKWSKYSFRTTIWDFGNNLVYITSIMIKFFCLSHFIINFPTTKAQKGKFAYFTMFTEKLWHRDLLEFSLKYMENFIEGRWLWNALQPFSGCLNTELSCTILRRFLSKFDFFFFWQISWYLVEEWFRWYNFVVHRSKLDSIIYQINYAIYFYSS